MEGEGRGEEEAAMEKEDTDARSSSTSISTSISGVAPLFDFLLVLLEKVRLKREKRGEVEEDCLLLVEEVVEPGEERGDDAEAGEEKMPFLRGDILLLWWWWS